MAGGVTVVDHDHRPETVFIQGGLRGCDHVGVVGKAEIVVGAKVKETTAPGAGADLDVGALRTLDQSLVLQQSLGLDIGEDVVEMGNKGRLHRTAPLGGPETSGHTGKPVAPLPAENRN